MCQLVRKIQSFLDAVGEFIKDPAAAVKLTFSHIANNRLIVHNMACLIL